MKSIYILSLLALTAAPAVAQHSVTPTNPPIGRPTDRAMKGAGERTVDTLDQCLVRSSGVECYTYSPDVTQPGKVLPVTGTNTLYNFLLIKYRLQEQATIKGLLVSYGFNMTNGSPDTLYCTIHDGDGQDGCPSQMEPLAMQSFTTSSLDTSSQSLRFTPIFFDEPAVRTENFCAMVQTRSFASTGVDIMGIYSNRHGDGKGEKRTMWMNADMTTGKMSVGYLGDLFSFGGTPIDIDPFVLPVVEFAQASSGVASPISIDGITLREISPNPAVDRATLRIALSAPSSIDLRVIDMSGRVVRTVDVDRLEAGEHSLSLDLTGVAAGSYLCSIESETGRFATSLTVVR